MYTVQVQMYPHNVSMVRDMRFQERLFVANVLTSYSINVGQFRFVQLEHRGGFCDCWAVANFTVTNPGRENISMLE